MNNKIVKILLGISILISLCLVHKILTYFFGDYYNLSNYDSIYYNDEGTDNYLRKSGYIYFPSEHFNALDIGTKYSEGDESSSNFKYSSDVKLISRYGKTGFSNDYFIHYHYINSISTFDINEMMKEYSFYENGNDSILKKMEVALRSNSYNPQYTTIHGKKAIKYYVKEKTPIKILITCSNNRMYFLETQSDYRLDYESNIYCSQFFFTTIHTSKDLIIWFILLAILSIIVVSFTIFAYRRKGVSNRYAYSLFVVGVISLIVNITIASCQSYFLYTDLYASNLSVYDLMGSLLTASCVSTPLCVFYLRKSRLKWEKDYLVPSLLKRMLYDKIQSKTNKSVFVLCICYPLMVLSLLPFGIYIVLFYSIPVLSTISIIMAVIIYFKKWHHWVKGSKTS